MTSPYPTTPRFHTPRTPGSRTLGGKVARLATALGRPPKRWQRAMYDVALELDDRGRARYHTVLISVPRQAGKTVADMMLGAHRTLTTPGGQVWFTAQTGQAARERWIKELAQPADQALSGLVRTKYGAGDTRLIIPATNAQFRPMPPTADYLHGEQADSVFIDEAWAHTEAEGAALLQAIIPTMATRQDVGIGPQLYFSSTKGTAASTWWHDRLSSAIEDQPPGVAVIDYGIADDVDPTDLDAVAAAHPAIGEGMTMKALTDAAAVLSPAEFARGFGNVATTTTSAVFDAGALDAAETDRPLDAGAVHLGIAVSWTHDVTAIVAAGYIDGTPAVEVIEARPGVMWAVDVVAEVDRRHAPASITIDAHGPAAGLAEHLADRLGDRLTIASADDLIHGTERLLSTLGAAPPGVLIRRDPELRAEIAGAQLRSIGDKGRVFSRKQSLTSIARLEAALLAVRRLTAVQTTAVAPMIWSPEQ